MKAVLLALIALLTCARANATGLIAGATEFTQIANNIQLVLGYIEQIQQTITQAKQYETMLRNLQKLSPNGQLDQQAQALWRDQNMVQTFKNLRNVVVNGQQMAYSASNLESQFKKLHPGYADANKDVNYFKAYRNWSDTTLSSVKSATSLTTMHSENFASEEGMVSELTRQATSAGGQLEAAKAGHDIGIAMVGQLQKLRQLQIGQMNAQNAYIAGQQSATDTKVAGLETVFGAIKTNRLVK